MVKMLFRSVYRCRSGEDNRHLRSETVPMVGAKVSCGGNATQAAARRLSLDVPIDRSQRRISDISIVVRRDACHVLLAAGCGCAGGRGGGEVGQESQGRQGCHQSRSWSGWRLSTGQPATRVACGPRAAVAGPLQW
ncbi:hypothetical protein GGTG_07836 [Gaeumannomyces tritici R3-111a-1]|uniref:Uncharacterized protein n=1 Tax=Gaeumannomyces tritici (strain R3-111a-1) TaxID=644352 RepID=J3P2U4_GAET3|nr:hypothetical protein GGTG_07836 [Gaeumannomyces tritici R3-111a-1]EJT73986.1 hypothetical protein GGTG_07836 [Gaeumannomyces tritici R3-111a-1]